LTQDHPGANPGRTPARNPPAGVRLCESESPDSRGKSQISKTADGFPPVFSGKHGFPRARQSADSLHDINA
jgi:hypothetical protein